MKLREAFGAVEEAAHQVRQAKEAMREARAYLRRFDESLGSASQAIDELVNMGPEAVGDLTGGLAEMMAEGLEESGSVYRRMERIIERLERQSRTL